MLLVRLAVGLIVLGFVSNRGFWILFDALEVVFAMGGRAGFVFAICFRLCVIFGLFALGGTLGGWCWIVIFFIGMVALVVL